MARVYLRRPSKDDFREYQQAVQSSVEMHRPWVAPGGSPQAYATYLQRIQDPKHFGFFVCRKSDDRIAGLLTVGEITRGALQSAYLGYWGVAGFCGAGLMTEGVALVFDEAFGPLELHRLEVNIQPGNERSKRLAQRLGLRREGYSPRYLKVDGEWRDHERWAMLADEWPGSEKALSRVDPAR